MRLLCESMFIPIDKRTLILKNSGKWSFSYESKASIDLSQWGESIFGAQSWKEKILLHEYVSAQINRRTLIPRLVESKVFLMKPNHQYH